jgi:hypothetical protein
MLSWSDLAKEKNEIELMFVACLAHAHLQKRKKASPFHAPFHRYFKLISTQALEP